MRVTGVINMTEWFTIAEINVVIRHPMSGLVNVDVTLLTCQLMGPS